MSSADMTKVIAFEVTGMKIVQITFHLRHVKVKLASSYHKNFSIELYVKNDKILPSKESIFINFNSIPTAMAAISYSITSELHVGGGFES